MPTSGSLADNEDDIVFQVSRAGMALNSERNTTLTFTSSVNTVTVAVTVTNAGVPILTVTTEQTTATGGPKLDFGDDETELDLTITNAGTKPVPIAHTGS